MRYCYFHYQLVRNRHCLTVVLTVVLLSGTLPERKIFGSKFSLSHKTIAMISVIIKCTNDGIYSHMRQQHTAAAQIPTPGTTTTTSTTGINGINGNHV